MRHCLEQPVGIAKPKRAGAVLVNHTQPMEQIGLRQDRDLAVGRAADYVTRPANPKISCSVLKQCSNPLFGYPIAFAHTFKLAILIKRQPGPRPYEYSSPPVLVNRIDVLGRETILN